MGSPSLSWTTPPLAESAARPATCTRRQSVITEYVEWRANPLVSPERHTAVSFFDNGLALEPWAARGYSCVAYVDDDAEGECLSRRNIRVVRTRLTHVRLVEIGRRHAPGGRSDVAFACAAPPSKELSIVGARYWKAKRKRDPQFQARVVELIKLIHSIFESWECIFYISGPASSRLGTLWRHADYKYQPYDFGNHLPAHDVHPLYPEIIPARDAYSQRQGLWTSSRFSMPMLKPVTPTWKHVLSKRRSGTRLQRVSPVFAHRSAHTARACTPRGFARALCQRLVGE